MSEQGHGASDLLQAALERLEQAVADDPLALVAATDRRVIDQAITHALAALTTDANTHRLIEQFSPRTDRRPARASDVALTLRLLASALHDHTDQTAQPDQQHNH